MVLSRLFGNELKEGDYIELDTAELESASGKVPIKVDKMEDFSDSDRIQRTIRSGAIVMIKIKKLKEKDLSELKRAIEKLRKTSIAMNGDIAGISDDWVIVCPSYAHIVRE